MKKTLKYTKRFLVHFHNHYFDKKNYQKYIVTLLLYSHLMY